MIKWLLKKLHASIEIENGEVKEFYPKIPKSFIMDLQDIINSQNIQEGLLYIKMVSGQPHIRFKGNFDAAGKQRILNCWGVHRAKYK